MTARSVVAALAVMMLFASPRAAHAQIEDVTMTVEGLSCNLCAAGLDRSLQQVEGVAGVRVVLASQVVTVRLKPNVPVAPAQLRAAVDRSGQQLRGMELRLRGTLQRENGRYRLRPPAPAQVFAIRDHPRLDALAGKVVRLRGRVVSPDAAAVELQVIEVRP